MSSMCYLIQGKSVSVDSPGYQEALVRLYYGKKRPLCPCRKPPTPMYIAKVNGHWIVKRMPNTGSYHDLECKSYEIPGGLSGLDQLLGSAIKENNDDGLTALRFDFAMSKGTSKSISTTNTETKKSVKTEGKRLSLRGLLHFLWEQAEFNKWSPGMAGKRNWFIIRKYLYEAAKEMRAKKISLDGLLFIPEVFDLDQQQAINQRRQLSLKHLHDSGKSQLYMLIVAEMKGIAPARFGYKLVLKHLPDFPILLNDDIHRWMQKDFAMELEPCLADDNGHLIVIGTFSLNASGIAIIKEMALMVVNEQWIPYENRDELKLLAHLIQSNRRFIKCLRYNLRPKIPIASVILANKDNEQTAIYVCPTNASDDYRQALENLIEKSAVQGRIWGTGRSELDNTLPRQWG